VTVRVRRLVTMLEAALNRGFGALFAGAVTFGDCGACAYCLLDPE